MARKDRDREREDEERGINIFNPFDTGRRAKEGLEDLSGALKGETRGSRVECPECLHPDAEYRGEDIVDCPDCGLINVR